jgi:hypothetical protein
LDDCHHRARGTPQWTIGPVPSGPAAQWAEHLGGDVSAYDFSVDRAVVARAGIASKDYEMLPSVVEHGVWADAGTSSAGNPLVAIKLRLGALEYVATFERRSSGKTLALLAFAIRTVTKP